MVKQLFSMTPLFPYQQTIKKIPLPAPTGKRITYKRSYRGITALDKQIIPQDRFICHTQK